ncbi:chemotaxis protein CheA [Clostridium ganghwense]|uniref:histidine kinase n=1 Tax=Clostridium ganghwense TaxID=312089 RepID=A0ABT4CLJ3_9CLOT|nr:chemotaxis protein CheA [Clostridium ganghwense]MCY6369920.1 chemotaxis protein CheA [Clostridium ganghwense]
MMNEEFINDFIEEAALHTSNVEKWLLLLNSERENIDYINKIFRAVHSIKGTAGFFKLNKIVELAHSMENLFGKIRNNKYKLKDTDMDVVLCANDCLKTLSENVYDNENIHIDEHINQINNILQSDIKESSFEKVDYEVIEKAKKRGHILYEISINLRGDLKENNIEIMKLIQSVKSIGEIIDSNMDTNKVRNLEHFNESEATLYLIISSVLEKNLVALALDLDETKIHECIYEEVVDKKEDSNKNTIVMEEISCEEEMSDKLKIEQNEKKVIRQENSFNKEETIRVKLGLLNELLNLTGELVLGRNQLIRTMESHKKDIQGIDNILQNIDYVTSKLQGKIMQTRMQPMANVFDKFPRIIRDLSKSLNKDIKLELEGEEVELDKSIIEALADPLVHLVRNAADHGLESSKERQQKGKTSTGTIKLKAYYRAGYVIIDVIDDGKGIDIEEIKKKVLEKELVSSNELSKMTEKEIIELILTPGFSTNDSVTAISGRGVGMDVVKTNIKKLGGNIEIYTKQGKETTVRLIIPLTLAIISALIVESKNQKFVLPQINLKEIVRITPKDIDKKIEYVNDTKILRLRDKFLPIINLAEILEDKDENHCEVYSNKIIRVLVLKFGFKEFGLIVDEIHDDEEILVKSLPRYLKDLKCYAGVTILGDGKVAMILDVNGIVEKAKLKLKDESELIKLKRKEEKDKDIKEQSNLMLFKCSQHETFGVDLSFIQRVEEIKLNDIELIGDNEYVKIRGNSLRIIRPSKYIPVSRQQENNKKYYVIILKHVKYPVGILIDKIYDTVETYINLNTDDFDYKGILGSTIIEDKIILILNVYELLELAVPEKYTTQTVKESLEEDIKNLCNKEGEK